VSTGQGRQAFRVGRVLGRSFRIWARNILPFTVLCVILYAPLVPWRLLAHGRSVAALTTLGGALLWIVAPLAVIDGVLRQLRGEPARLGGCLRRYFTRLLPVLGVAMLVSLAEFSGMMAGSVLAGMLNFAGLPRPLSMTMLLAIMAYIYCMFLVSVPVAAVERPGILASLGRSEVLTRGSRAALFAILLVALAVQLVPLFLARIALGNRTGPAATLVMSTLAVALNAYTAVSTAVAYHDLRVAKEGVGVRELAHVFS